MKQQFNTPITAKKNLFRLNNEGNDLTATMPQNKKVTTGDLFVLRPSPLMIQGDLHFLQPQLLAKVAKDGFAFADFYDPVICAFH